MKWEKLCDYTVMGERIIIKDVMIMISEDEKTPEWPCVTVNPGKYQIDFSQEDGLIIAVRIHKKGSDFELGSRIGELGIDHAKAGFCDYDTLLKEVKDNPDEYIAWTEDECEEAIWNNEKGEVTFKNHKMVFLKPGDGDGIYPVFELLDDKQVIGMHCKFESIDHYPVGLSKINKNNGYDSIHPKDRSFWEIERIIYDDTNDRLSIHQIASLREYIRRTFKKKEYEHVIELESLILKYLDDIDLKMLAFSKRHI